MKRDWELIREILLKLEGLESTESDLRPEAMSPHSPDAVAYHLHLLKQAGLIEAIDAGHLGMPLYCIGQRLTWNGHELLDSIRQKSVWDKVKAKAAEKGLDLTFDVVKALGAWALKSALGLDTS